MKSSCELPAGAGKFPPVTRRNRRHLVLADIFACIRRYFYLRISSPAAFAGNFAGASFTVTSGQLIFGYQERKLKNFNIVNSHQNGDHFGATLILFCISELFSSFILLLNS